LKSAFRALRARVRTSPSAAGPARDARHLAALPSPRAFEVSPEEPAERVVLLQTRLWPSDDPAVLAINEQRAGLIRALRAAFGTRFIGGAIPSDYANRHHPDLVTSLPSSMRSYPKLVRRALVGVYSRGLHGSVAFKMSEYLAAGRCIVAEAPESLLPQPLQEGTNYLRFKEPDTCVEQCERLLSDPERAQRMRQANWEYYQSHVEPGAHLLRILERAFERPTSGLTSPFA